MDQGKTRELARRIVEASAPDELDLFDIDADAYFADPARMLAGDPDRDRPLASGLSHVIHSLTPIALFLAGHALDVVTDHGIEEGGKQARAGWRKFRKSREGAPTTPPPLAAFEVRQGKSNHDPKVGVVAVFAGREFPMPAEQAARVMITLVNELGGGPAQPPPAPGS
jgi:hypothetical protein